MSKTTKTALITGVSGQDGSYLTELLLQKGYSVTGIARGAESVPGAEVIAGDIGDQSFVESVVARGFDEIYNLASIATVADPMKDTDEISRITGEAPGFFLESILTHSPKTRFFQASSAEMYGDATITPQDEMTPFSPVTPYGKAKLKAHELVEQYRTEHRVFAVSGILFNHESPRRPESFVTRKITSTLARISKGSSEVLTLGNLNAKRDWSFAGDVVRGMWQSLQAPDPDTYVFASGVVHTVREFVDAAAQTFDMPIAWSGEGEREIGVDSAGKVIVRVDLSFFRPLEAHVRCGNPAKAKEKLGWTPQVSFQELVRMMVETDLKNQ